eukprot:jgi/Botrbrau1/23442/Bobra.106_1s0003.1
MMQLSLYPPSTASAYVCCSRRDTLVRLVLSHKTACYDISSVRSQLRNAHSIPNVYRIPAKVAAARGRRIVSPSAILGGLGKLIGGDPAEKTRKAYQGIVDQINALEAGLAALSDEKLRAKTEDFKARYKKGETLDDLLVEAFAVVREASRRVLGLRPFDVQLIGGMILHKGQIAEMRTGEGKTLVAILPAYLNALSGKGVHVVTVNDYLARRDSEWVGQVPRFLGMTVGLVQQSLGEAERKAAYASDITYVTNSELGFDYLRDNLSQRFEDLVQRPFNFCIIDEVDLYSD